MRVPDDGIETGRSGFVASGDGLLELKDDAAQDAARTDAFKANKLVGICCVLTVGVLAGSVMVPLKLASNNGVSGVAFLPSFGIGVGIMTLIILGISSVANGKLPEFHVRVGLLPGCLSGTCWAVGNLGSILASLSPLGQTAGYP